MAMRTGAHMEAEKLSEVFGTVFQRKQHSHHQFSYGPTLGAQVVLRIRVDRGQVRIDARRPAAPPRGLSPYADALSGLVLYDL